MSNLQSSIQGQKGLCLPEILVSCLIAVVGLTCILNCFLTGRLASTGAKHWTQAMNLARARLEYLKSLRYVDLSAMPSATTESNLPLDERDEGSVTCTRVTAFTKNSDGITISVLVVWNERAVGGGFVPWAFQLRTWVGFPGSPIIQAG